MSWVLFTLEILTSAWEQILDRGGWEKKKKQNTSKSLSIYVFHYIIPVLIPLYSVKKTKASSSFTAIKVVAITNTTSVTVSGGWVCVGHYLTNQLSVGLNDLNGPFQPKGFYKNTPGKPFKPNILIYSSFILFHRFQSQRDSILYLAPFKP